MPEETNHSPHHSTVSSEGSSPSSRTRINTRRSSSSHSLERFHSHITPQTERKHSGGERTDSTNSLTLQSISTAKSSQSSYSIDSSSLQSVSRTSADDPAPTWKASVRRIVSVLNLVPKEKTPQEKEEEQKLREQGMFLTRPAICRQPLKSVSRFCISLSGCGFLGSYHFGAVNCFMRNGQHVLSRLERVSGASAGSLVASILLLVPEKLDPALKVLFDLGEELIHLNFGALTPGYYLNERLIKIVDDFLPQDISKAQGRLYISVTRRKERTNRLICHFSSREHLLQCLMASCYIPMYSMGYGAEPPHIDGDVSLSND
ncbi:phospholipase, patatin family [Ancylostoma caninum]|uniref:Phospholipase, patatin family n=1 Tax=Ancylostoma caninum TaxID=29170 RepID=A0A368GDA6_ANCCA|nr:phospholipase, patatin family [Ancylostoma caninum]